jgi:hypothetical protein
MAWQSPSDPYHFFFLSFSPKFQKCVGKPSRRRKELKVDHTWWTCYCCSCCVADLLPALNFGRRQDRCTFGSIELTRRNVGCLFALRSSTLRIFSSSGLSLSQLNSTTDDTAAAIAGVQESFPRPSSQLKQSRPSAARRRVCFSLLVGQLAGLMGGPLGHWATGQPGAECIGSLIA